MSCAVKKCSQCGWVYKKFTVGKELEAERSRGKLGVGLYFKGVVFQALDLSDFVALSELFISAIEPHLDLATA